MFGHCWKPQLSPQAVLERRWQWFGQVDTLARSTDPVRRVRAGSDFAES